MANNYLVINYDQIKQFLILKVLEVSYESL